MEAIDLRKKLAEVEKDYLEKALRATGGNATQAAKLLGVSRTGLQGRVRARGLWVPPYEAATDPTGEFTIVHPSKAVIAVAYKGEILERFRSFKEANAYLREKLEDEEV